MNPSDLVGNGGSPSRRYRALTRKSAEWAKYSSICASICGSIPRSVTTASSAAAMCPSQASRSASLITNGHVPGPQPRVAPLLAVGAGTAPVLLEEQRQVALRRGRGHPGTAAAAADRWKPAGRSGRRDRRRTPRPPPRRARSDRSPQATLPARESGVMRALGLHHVSINVERRRGGASVLRRRPRRRGALGPSRLRVRRRVARRRRPADPPHRGSGARRPRPAPRPAGGRPRRHDRRAAERRHRGERPVTGGHRPAGLHPRPERQPRGAAPDRASRRDRSARPVGTQRSRRCPCPKKPPVGRAWAW